MTLCVEEGHLKEGTKIPEEIHLISYPSTAVLSADSAPQTVDIVIAENPKPEHPTNTDALLRLQPKEYVVGMGCKRGIKPQKIEALIDETLKTAGMKDRKSTRLNSSHQPQSRMPSSA